MSRELARPALFFLHNASVKSCLRGNLRLVQSGAMPPRQLVTHSRVSEFVRKSVPRIWGGNQSSPAGKQVRANWQNGFSVRRMFSSAGIRRAVEATPSPTTSTATPAGRVVTDKKVGYWLIGSACLVFGIVILGGLTRLTESGLSITEWKPIAGSIPPITQEEWDDEFSKYKLSPEFKLLNSNITLEEFKSIFYMEWGHRLWGRAIGLLFVIPGIYFVAAKKTSSHITRRILIIAGLIGFQGFIGWWMVKSGLSDHFLAEDTADGKYKDNHPRVSQYRLATHLGLAFVVYLAMMWNGLEILKENRWAKDPKAAFESFAMLNNPALRKYKLAATALLGLVFTTAMSGAFVAGLDAGLVYNSFPYMGEGFVPPKSELFSSFYARNPDDSDLVWRNMLENPVTVQLTHRILATTAFCTVVGFHIASTRLFKRGLLPRNVFRASHGVIGFALLQVTLGISTLLYLVPIPLAASHQAGSLALLTEVLILCLRLRRPRGPLVKALLDGVSKVGSK
ncbi:cytochrome oxidase assembly protein-domain-containing protein [Lipomyces arxii]|uniref:cytochrome oxidase assembly protein-domain-containing protein n=1 Tax=Lipomyces arxii TaxID=56418 RepID=UPI0034CD538C